MKHILITTGPTREYLDPVRYLSSDSSGRMGFAFARAARKLGARVTLISGPVTLATPKSVKRIDVVSAKEMRNVVLRESKKADMIIMAAAISDWRPHKKTQCKLKRHHQQNYWRLPLQQNPDILLELGARKKASQVLIGFALESKGLQKNALKKLHEKKCDWIVANGMSAVGATHAKALLLHKDGAIRRFPLLPKSTLARRLLMTILNPTSPQSPQT